MPQLPRRTLLIDADQAGAIRCRIACHGDVLVHSIVRGERTEASFVSTNASAQYGLAAIQCLALVGDHLPN